MWFDSWYAVLRILLVGAASYLTLHQSRMTANTGGHYEGNVVSFGTSFCGSQAC